MDSRDADEIIFRDWRTFSAALLKEYRLFFFFLSGILYLLLFKRATVISDKSTKHIPVFKGLLVMFSYDIPKITLLVYV